MKRTHYTARHKSIGLMDYYAASPKLVLPLVWVSILSCFAYIVFYEEEVLYVFSALKLKLQCCHSSSSLEPDDKRFLEPVCKIPELNPFDPVVLPYLVRTRHKSCDKVQPYLSYVDEDNYLYLNETELKAISGLGSNYTNIKCQYSMFDRANGTRDTSHDFNPYEPLEADRPVLVTKDMVHVRCTSGTRSEIQLYTFYHAVIASTVTDEQAAQNEQFKPENEDQLSVVVILIDGTSLTMAQRNLPNTYRFLREDMKAFVLRSYNKIGLNSLPNAIALLTGKRIYDTEPGMEHEFSDNFAYEYSDDWPLIWKHFSKQGYVTMYNEDEPNWGLFQYNTYSFSRKPVDHYFTPFWREMVRQVRWFSSELCYGNQFSTEIQVDIIRRFLVKYKGIRKFGFSFISQLVHSYDTRLELGDELFYRFLKEMFQEGYLNRTLLVVGSDHGPRFGGHRGTRYGQLEYKLPFMSLVFPPWFLEKYPQLAENLELNQQMLSGNFDIHETMMDVLQRRFNDEQRPKGTRGLSLLYPIPRDRNCTGACIPVCYCACLEEEEVDSKSRHIIKAGRSLITFINRLLGPLNDSCQPWTFGKVSQATVYVKPKSLGDETALSLSNSSFTSLANVTLHLVVQVWF